MAHECYGLKRLDDASDEDYVHRWEESNDANDMLLPESQFIVFADDNVSESIVKAKLTRKYPNAGPDGLTISKAYSGRLGRHVWSAKAFTQPLHRSPNRRGIVAFAAKIAETTTQPFLVFVDYDAKALLRESVYTVPEYDTAPFVLRSIKSDDRVLLVTPSVTAAKVRAGRLAGAKARRDKKTAANEKREAADAVRRAQHAAAGKYRNAIERATVALLRTIPPVAACAHVSYITCPRDETPGDDYGRVRHVVCGFRATTALARRLAPAMDWRAIPVVRSAVAEFVTAGALVGTDDFDKFHPSDRADLVWFRRTAKAVTKLVSVAAATPSGE